nr:unnamed protein product [Callosobruchus analis]
MKHHLYRVLQHNVTYEELNTLIIEIEGIMNSRPLFVSSNDPNDLNPISPSHFLIGRAITTIPDPNLTKIAEHRLPRLQHLQQLYQRFWKHYISQLHQQYKWRSSPSKPVVGSVVLIKNDQQPPCRWPIGRIVELFHGRDGICRTASIKTNKGYVVRSIRHLCPLPFYDELEH